MAEVRIRINKEALRIAEKVLGKYGVDLEGFLERIVNELLIHDLEEIDSFIQRHDYGDMDGLEKLVNGFMDLVELGILTHTGLEDYVLSELDTNRYWLQDYGLDLDDLSVWLLFMGSGLVDEFIIDADCDGVTLTATHSIDDLVEKDPGIIDRLSKAIEEIDTDLDIIVEEDHVKIVVRTRSLSELPQITYIEDTLSKLFEKIGVKR